MPADRSLEALQNQLYNDAGSEGAAGADAVATLTVPAADTGSAYKHRAVLSSVTARYSVGTTIGYITITGLDDKNSNTGTLILPILGELKHFEQPLLGKANTNIVCTLKGIGGGGGPTGWIAAEGYFETA